MQQQSVSVIHPLGRIAELLLRPLGIASRGVEVFVAEDLGEGDQIVFVVFEELMRHGVAQEVRVDVRRRSG